MAADFVLQAVEQTAVRYGALCADAATISANAACVPTSFHYPGVRIGSVRLTVEVVPWQQEEARRLAILRRIADIAGREAVREQAAKDIQTSTQYVAPNESWLHVAQAMDRLARDSDSDTRKGTIMSLANWAIQHDRDLAVALTSVVNGDQSP